MYLVDGNFKVVLKGEIVSPRNDEEFVIDESKPTLHKIATYKEVAEANGIQVSGKKLQSIFESLLTGLNNLKVKTMTEEVEKNEAEEIMMAKCTDIIKAAFAEGDVDENEVLVQIVNSGVSFRNAQKVYKQITEDLGLRVSAKDRYEQVVDLLGDSATFDEYSDVEGAVQLITKKVGDTSAPQAMAALRKFAKENEIELPKKPKGSKGDGKPRGFKAVAYAWIMDNKDCTKDELSAFLKENEQREVYVNYYWDLIKFAKQYNS